MRLGRAQHGFRSLTSLLAELSAEFADLPDAALGVEITAIPIKPRHTDEQISGYWLLITEWLKIAQGQRKLINVDKETLHRWVCATHFGRIERQLPDGSVDSIPFRTITSVWSDDQRRYKKQRLTVELFTDLIEYIYRTAAEGGVVLPDLEK